MRLLYCYVQFLDEHGKDARYRGLDKIELNFSTVDRFEYVRLTGTLHRHRRKCPLPEHFWNVETAENSEKLAAPSEDTNIYNINVVSGENGSGKTTAMHYLIDLLDGFHAAVDPFVSDHNRMERLGVAGNRALLLLESKGSCYLLDYWPVNYETGELHFADFRQSDLQVFRCIGWQGLSKTQDQTKKIIARLLCKTKVIYLNNTMSQRDYERHIDQNERLRDFFVYDASIGATIGPDIAQFFPYEVYKQVKYVFDKNQVAKRAAIKDRVQLRLPKALRLRPRTELLERMYEGHVQNGPETSGTTARRMRNGQGFQGVRNLSSLLGRLCVAAFIENLRGLLDIDFRPLFRDELMSSFNEGSTLQGCADLLEDITQQYRFAVSSYSFKGQADAITCVAALPDGRFVSGSRDGMLRIWDAATGACLVTLEGHRDVVECVAALPEGRIISGSRDCTLKVWDGNTGKWLYDLWGQEDEIWCVAVLPKGGVVSGSRNGTLRVWDVNTGVLQLNLLGHGRAVGCVAALPEGLIVSGSRDRTLRVWDADTGVCLRTLDGHEDTVWCVAALPGGRCVSGSHDGTLKVWDVATGTCVRTLDGHKDAVTCVATLPDGFVISGSRDCTLKVWDIDTGECIHTLLGHKGAIECVAVLSGGRIVSGSRDGTIRIWLSYLWNTGKSEDAGITAGQRLVIMTSANHLEQLCMDYLHFLSEKDASLFSRFTRIDQHAYELSLETMDEKKEDALYANLIDFMHKYRYICEPTYTIDFDWGLSSGEENMLRIFSNLYHVFDRHYSGGQYGDYRIYNNESHSDDDSAKTPCDSVLLFMDEADLTLHPEWQRRLISILATFIPQIYPRTCANDIQLILSTHSPLLLGDIPSENITYLPPKKKQQPEKKEDTSEKSDGAGQSTRFAPSNAYEIETFGQNVHTILKESFFLNNGTVGDFAGKRINRIAAQLKSIEERASSEANTTPAVWEELQEIEQNMNVVAHGILRTRLEMLYRDAEAAIKRQESAGSTPSVQQLLSDARALSKDDRYQLLLALSEES